MVEIHFAGVVWCVYTLAVSFYKTSIVNNLVINCSFVTKWRLKYVNSWLQISTVIKWWGRRLPAAIACQLLMDHICRTMDIASVHRGSTSWWWNVGEPDRKIGRHLSPSSIVWTIIRLHPGSRTRSRWTEELVINGLKYNLGNLYVCIYIYIYIYIYMFWHMPTVYVYIINITCSIKLTHADSTVILC